MKLPSEAAVASAAFAAVLMLLFLALTNATISAFESSDFLGGSFFALGASGTAWVLRSYWR